MTERVFWAGGRREEAGLVEEMDGNGKFWELSVVEVVAVEVVVKVVVVAVLGAEDAVEFVLKFELATTLV